MINKLYTFLAAVARAVGDAAACVPFGCTQPYIRIYQEIREKILRLTERK